MHVRGVLYVMSPKCLINNLFGDPPDVYGERIAPDTYATCIFNLKSRKCTLKSYQRYIMVE